MGWMEQFERLLSKDRRGGWRKPVRVPVQVALEDGSVLGCELTEASPSGFRLRAPRKLPRKEALRLRFPGRLYRGDILEIPAEIVWARSVGAGAFAFRAGGRFLSMSDGLRKRLAERLLITSGMEMGDVIEKRRHARMNQAAVIGNENLVVRDISLEGVGLLAQRAPALGERVEILVNPDDPVRCEGTVVWNRPALGGHAWYVGVRFDALPEVTRRQLIEHLATMMKTEGMFDL